MREVKPKVFLVASTVPRFGPLQRYLDEMGADPEWTAVRRCDGFAEAETLVEFGGRLCYRSWKAGLNPNVSRIREDRGAYLRNILASRHGSVLEHVSYSFVFHHVSRILTHELARHRAGTAISQESMRFVRLTDLPFWIPEWVDDPEVRRHGQDLLARMEWFQNWMAGRFGLDAPGTPFSRKKVITSFMRRFAPDGVATGVLWTANVRALRHAIEVRTAASAEEEIRLVFGRVAEIMKAEAPGLFGDFTRAADGSWVPEWSKV